MVNGSAGSADASSERGTSVLSTSYLAGTRDASPASGPVLLELILGNAP